MDLKDRLRGCLIAGAIGDAIGGRYEGSDGSTYINFDFNVKVFIGEKFDSLKTDDAILLVLKYID